MIVMLQSMKSRQALGAALGVLFVGIVGVAPATASATESDAVRDFWTAERMRDAVAAGDPLTREVGKEWPDSARPGPTAGAQDEIGTPWTGGGDIAKTSGRLFFTVVEDGEIVPSSCSANVVDSANESVIMTAGHCAHGEDYLFVPGYDDGEMPFGGWSVAEIFRPEVSGIVNDFAAFALDELDGKTIQDVVGAQAIAFDAPRPDRLDLFGYPRERKNDPDRPYEGKELIHSSGSTLDNPMGLIGVVSDSGRGVSGGAFLADFDPETGHGTQVAAVSGAPCMEIGEDDECTVVGDGNYGVPFNSVAHELYERASRV